MKKQQSRPGSIGGPGSASPFKLHFGLDLSGCIPSVSTSPPPVQHRGMAVSPTSLCMRSRGTLVPRKILLGARDKEALLEEIMELKRVLSEQDGHIKYHKVHTHNLEIENKKLEKDIEDLEAQGTAEAPRTGRSTRLRAKLQGLKMRINELHSISIAQQEELFALRRDLRVSHTKEVELERDVFAGEVGNMQRLARKLSASHNKICCENKLLGRLKDKGALLEASHERLEFAMNAAQEILQRGSHELKGFKNKAREAILEASRNTKKCKEMQQHSQLMEDLLSREKGERDYLEKRVFDLAQELRRVDNQLQHIKGFTRLDAFRIGSKKHPPDVESVKSSSGRTSPKSKTPPPSPSRPSPPSKVLVPVKSIPSPGPPPKAPKASPAPSKTSPAPSKASPAPAPSKASPAPSKASPTPSKASPTPSKSPSPAPSKLPSPKALPPKSPKTAEPGKKGIKHKGE